MAILAYLRVSTDEQARSGLGMDAQLEAIEQAAGSPDAIYRDDGFSGSDTRRQGLLDALDALTEGDALVVAKRDRLARDVFFSAWIEKEAKKRRARIVSAAGEGTDNDEPASKLMRTIVDAFAEYERNLISARTAAALQQKRRRGEKTGGGVPFGKQLAADGTHLVDDAEEQRILSLIVDLRDQGWSLRQIGAEMGRRGIPTKTGKVNWNPKTISALLRRVA